MLREPNAARWFAIPVSFAAAENIMGAITPRVRRNGRGLVAIEGENIPASIASAA